MSVLVCLSLLDDAKVRIVCEHINGLHTFYAEKGFFLT